MDYTDRKNTKNYQENNKTRLQNVYARAWLKLIFLLRRIKMKYNSTKCTQ